MTFSFLLRLSLCSCEFPNSLFHTSGQEPQWRGGSLRWTQMGQKKGHACPFLSYIDSSPHFWMALGHPGLCHCCFFFFFPNSSSCNTLCPCFPIPSLTVPSSCPWFLPFPFFKSPKCMLRGICRMGREKVGVDDHVLILQVTNARLKSWVHDEDCLGRKVRCKRE